MGYDPKVALVHRFFSGTGSSYDYMVNLGTLGFDLWWKKRILDKIPATAKRIVDHACGTGILTLKIARKFPGAQVIGVELRDEYLRLAKAKTNHLGLQNVRFILGRAEDVLLREKFDCITSSYLAKYADLETLVLNGREMLRPGGVLLMHDFSYPPNHFFATLWELYFTLAMQKIGAALFPEWSTVYYELPGMMRRTDWIHILTKSLRENHFSDIDIEHLTFGTSTIITARNQGRSRWVHP